MTIDDEGQSEDKDDEDNKSVNNEEQSEADSVGGGDNWDSDNDEELLNTVALSRNGVRIRHSSNIGLLSATDQIEKVRDVQVIVQGKGQTTGQLLRQLLLTKLGRHMWPAAERLCIDMRNAKRFHNFPEYDTSEFSMLTSLEFRHSIRNYIKLKMFAASPISSLVLYCSPYYFDEGLDLSVFRGLRSLSIPFLRIMNKGIVIHVNKALSTVCPSLQHLSLAMNLDKDLQLPFADSLVSLTLEGGYGQHDVEHLLQMLPNLRKFSVCAIFSEPIFSVSKLVDESRCANATQSLMPIHSLLRTLEA
ncbi:hypothetical protein H4R27_000487 [Coemansia aciculifera]|nr:hypothetical protein H4R27_000487 [Coemansia aciculifera]